MRARRGAIGVQSSTGANRGAGWIGHYLAYKAASRPQKVATQGMGREGGANVRPIRPPATAERLLMSAQVGSPRRLRRGLRGRCHRSRPHSNLHARDPSLRHRRRPRAAARTCRRHPYPRTCAPGIARVYRYRQSV
eukprot:scaffold47951_cov31-Tisochrysis_lutea.AAC.6